MTRFDLFLELTFSINHLLEGGITTTNLHEAHQMMEYSFDRFEEYDGVQLELSEMSMLLDGIDIKLLEMPSELKEYFQVLSNFVAQNEIFLSDLPPKYGTQTTEQVQLMIGLFNILNDLLEIGMTSCHVHVARMKIDELFQSFELEEDNTPNFLDHLFPNLKDELNVLTIKK